MNNEKILNLVNDLIGKESAQSFNFIQEIILTGSFNDQTYQQIAENHYLSESYVKEAGANLWHYISDILGIKVSKKTFKSIILTHLIKSKSSANIINCFAKDNFTINNINTVQQIDRSPEYLAKKKLFFI